MQARILIDTLTRHLQLASSTSTASKKTYKTFLRIILCIRIIELNEYYDVFISDPLCQILCLKALKTQLAPPINH